MKELLAATFLTISFLGISQNETTNNQHFYCDSLSSFQSDLRSYHLKIKDANESPTLESTYSFNELPTAIDSLEKLGYQLKFIHGVDGNFQYCLGYGDSASFALDSLTFEKLHTINKTCSTGRYAGGPLGDKYFVFHSTRPTGLIREVFYYLIKED